MFRVMGQKEIASKTRATPRAASSKSEAGAGLHMVKLAAGVKAIEEMERWCEVQARRSAQRGLGDIVHVATRSMPTRREEIVASQGSIYWVFAGFVQCRQRVVGIDREEGGAGRCILRLDPCLVKVRRQPRKAFQGWRYLDASDAPPDLAEPGPGATEDLQEMPPEMLKELSALGVI